MHPGMQAFRDLLTEKHVRVQTDNITTVAYINHMGGIHSNKCNLMAREIWHFAHKYRMWLTAVHLPGKDNTLADEK